MRVVQTAGVELHDVVDYRCGRCGHTARVGVAARGHAEADVFGTERNRELLAMIAEVDAHKAIEEMVALAACPQCHTRDRRAARRALWRRFGMSFGAGVVASIGGLAIASSLDANPLIGMAVATVVVTALVWPWRYLRALRRADGVAFLPA